MGRNLVENSLNGTNISVETTILVTVKNDAAFEMPKKKNDAKTGNDADLSYKQGGIMAYIKKKSERKFKITVCNGYKVNGQKRMKAQTITVPSSVPKRGIQQYVMAEAERIEKKFKYGIEESKQTHFDRYAEVWLNRQKPYFKATTLAGYRRNLEIVCPFIGGISLAKIRPLTLEEMCEELRKRPGRNGSVKECTVQKYLETVSSVLEDAKKNDIIPFNPAHRVRKKCAEKEKQHIPQKYEMQRLLKIIMDEPILYKAYYTMAIATGLRRGELCALRWEDITGPYEFTIRRSRSYVAGQGIVESDTKNHRERVIVIPAQVWEFLMSLRHWQTIRSGKPDNSQPTFTDLDGHVPNPDTFTRHLRKLYAKNGFPKEYHLHTLRHYYRQRAMNAGWQETGYLILKVDSPNGYKPVFTSEEVRHARSAVNQLRNKKIQQGQYTDATDDMLLKLADVPTFRRM